MQNVSQFFHHGFQRSITVTSYQKILTRGRTAGEIFTGKI